MLEGFDLTGSYRDAAELAGCSPNTVARYVSARRPGGWCRVRRRRGRVRSTSSPRSWRNSSSGPRARSAPTWRTIVAMGFAGSERTTRRAVAEIRKAWPAGRCRVHRPWIPEPGMWAGV